MPWYFHIDLDAFYASVEQLDHPQLRGRAVIVGGANSSRGVVSACSYEARAFGVHSAMPIFKARSLCPEGHYMPVRMQRYQQVSEHIMSIFDRYSPHVQQISIDEAFLDMSGTQSLMGPVEEVAARIQQHIIDEVGLTASIGIATNKYIAKMASDRNKPCGICFVPSGGEYDFITETPLPKLWGIGKQGIMALHSKHIHTVQQLRAYSLSWLQRNFGQASGAFYHTAVRGEDPGIFSAVTKSRSVSNETTLEENTTDEQLLKGLFHQLAHHVMFRLMKNGLIAQTIGIKYKLSTFVTRTAQCTPAKTIYSAEEVFSYAWELFTQRWDHQSPIRLIGISLSSIEERSEPLQDELFFDTYQRKHEVEKTVLQLRSKGNKIMKASDLLYDRHHIQRHKDS
ncbi:MAG: DNA polymerase IV [Spirochaetia bacterium]|nr:DNA polymerase IV [Spirochaetia bacterium]